VRRVKAGLTFSGERLTGGTLSPPTAFSLYLKCFSTQLRTVCVGYEFCCILASGLCRRTVCFGWSLVDYLLTVVLFEEETLKEMPRAGARGVCVILVPHNIFRFEIPPLLQPGEQGKHYNRVNPRFSLTCKLNQAGSRPMSTQQGRFAVCSLVDM
jgi:hypothetical protein